MKDAQLLLAMQTMEVLMVSNTIKRIIRAFSPSQAAVLHTILGKTSYAPDKHAARPVMCISRDCIHLQSTAKQACRMLSTSSMAEPWH